MYDSLKDKQVDDSILQKEKELTVCYKSKQGSYNGKWICFCCGMPYKKVDFNGCW